MIPFHLTLADVKAAALEAHATSRLCAQTKRDRALRNSPTDPANSYYISHAHPGTGCAVGVAVPPEVASALQARTNYCIRANLDLVAINPAELDAIVTIQNAHDHWANYAYVDANSPHAAAAEEGFLSLIR